MNRFSRRSDQLKPSALREILKAAAGSRDVISFAGGLPAADLFPVDDLLGIHDAAMRESGRSALQYSVTEGIDEMRSWVAQRTARRFNVDVDPEHVLITTGSQEGLDLFARVHLDPGDTVALSVPAYVGALQAFASCEPRYLIVERDDDGLIPESLDAALRSVDTPPKFLYIIPNYDNPCGSTLAVERRRAIVEICARYGLPILEDDPYGEIAFDRPSPPPLLSFDTTGGVTYLGTGSKLLSPGMRIAWAVVPDEQTRTRMVIAKQASSLHTSSYVQYVFHGYVRDDRRLEKHLQTIKDAYRSRRDTMLAGLAATMPEHVRWNTPDGGMFLWVSLGHEIDAEEVARFAAALGVVVVPGSHFYPDRRISDGMRLNFTAMPENRIGEGLQRLAAAIESARPLART